VAVPPRRRRSLHPGDDRPLRIQLAQALADEIARGVYEQSEDFPGERALAEKWSVSDKTTREAIALLVSKGLLRKGLRTQPATVIGSREDAVRVRTELAQSGGVSDTERIDDLERQVRQLSDRLGQTDAAVRAIEQRERKQAQDRTQEQGDDRLGESAAATQR
jgi:DNA-binding GntR family transcriptional regulator